MLCVAEATFFRYFCFEISGSFLLYLGWTSELIRSSTCVYIISFVTLQWNKRWECTELWVYMIHLHLNTHLFINTGLGCGIHREKATACIVLFHRDWLCQVRACWHFVPQLWLKKLYVYLIMPSITSQHALRLIQYTVCTFIQI